VALLEYDRVAVESGEWWRLITAHLVHLDSAHLFANAVAMVMLLIICRGSRVRQLLQLPYLMAGSGVVMYFLAPQVQWYLGLSGVLHGLWLICSMQQSPPVRSWMVALLMLKLSLETVTVGFRTASPVEALPEGHLSGVVAAALWLLARADWSSSRKSEMRAGFHRDQTDNPAPTNRDRHQMGDYEVQVWSYSD
jgi:rhomboid family GlyGly-CTERM serine protease